MEPDYGTQYEENPSSHQGGMAEDGHPDKWTRTFYYIPWFHLGEVGNNHDNDIVTQMHSSIIKYFPTTTTASLSTSALLPAEQLLPIAAAVTTVSI